MDTIESREEERVLYFMGNYVEKINSHFSQLGEAEKLAARYILDNGSACSQMSIKTLAEHSGCSTASIVRLCKDLGYSGFSELKFQIQQNSSAFSKDNLSISHLDDPRSMKQKTLRFAQHSLNTTVQNLDDASLEKAVEALVNARQVLFCAMGSACGAALAGVNHLLSSGIYATFLMDDLLQMRNAAYFHPKDVVIGINYDGNAKGVADTFMVAKQAGATTILITSIPDGMISNYADIILYTPVRNTNNSLNFSTTTMCQLMIVQLLIIGVWQRSGSQLSQKSAEMRTYTNLKRYDPSIKELKIDYTRQ